MESREMILAMTRKIELAKSQAVKNEARHKAVEDLKQRFPRSIAVASPDEVVLQYISACGAIGEIAVHENGMGASFALNGVPLDLLHKILELLEWDMTSA